MFKSRHWIVIVLLIFVGLTFCCPQKSAEVRTNSQAEVPRERSYDLAQDLPDEIVNEIKTLAIQDLPDHQLFMTPKGRCYVNINGKIYFNTNCRAAMVEDDCLPKPRFFPKDHVWGIIQKTFYSEAIYILSSNELNKDIQPGYRTLKEEVSVIAVAITSLGRCDYLIQRKPCQNACRIFDNNGYEIPLNLGILHFGNSVEAISSPDQRWFEEEAVIELVESEYYELKLEGLEEGKIEIGPKSWYTYVKSDGKIYVNAQFTSASGKNRNNFWTEIDNTGKLIPHYFQTLKYKNLEMRPSPFVENPVDGLVMTVDEKTNKNKIIAVTRNKAPMGNFLIETNCADGVPCKGFDYSTGYELPKENGWYKYNHPKFPPDKYFYVKFTTDGQCDWKNRDLYRYEFDLTRSPSSQD